MDFRIPSGGLYSEKQTRVKTGVVFFFKIWGVACHLNLGSPKQFYFKPPQAWEQTDDPPTWQPRMASRHQNRWARLPRTYWLLRKNFGSLLERTSLQEASPLPAHEFTAQRDLTACSSSYSKLSLGLSPVASLHTYAIFPDSWPWTSPGLFATVSPTECLFLGAGSSLHLGPCYILSCLQTRSNCKAMLVSVGSLR